MKSGRSVVIRSGKDFISPYWCREKKMVLYENLYGSNFLYTIYTTFFGKLLCKLFYSKKPLNYLYGFYKRSFLSCKQITKDIKTYAIDMGEYKDKNYNNYEEFFLREFKEGSRKFNLDVNCLAAFGEGNYLAYESINDSITFPVKGEYL